MGRRRAAVPTRRTTIPQMYLELLGAKILNALQSEHVRYYATKKKRAKFTIERACVSTGIPYNTMNAYLWGRRQPSILDLRDICEFAGITFEEVMNIIPSRKQLDQIKDEERASLTSPQEDTGDDEDDWEDEDE